MDSFTLDKIEFDAIRHILTEFCSCSLGKSLALRIGPSRNPEMIAKWLRQVSQMVGAIRDSGVLPFGGVTDVSEALSRARPGAGATGEDFARIAATMEGALNIKRYLAALAEELDCLHELGAEIGDFSREIEAIRAVVGPDGTVMDDASPRLTLLRREIAATTQGIHDVIYGYLKQPDVAKLLQNVTVTLHGDRYVLPVKTIHRGRLAGVVHRESNTGATLFVEPVASVELNNRLADLRQDERGEVERLLADLAVRVQGRTVEMAATLRSLAQADVLSAKAQYAYQFDMTCPELTENGPLEFAQARHPLLVDQARRQEKAGIPPDERHPVVPIDVRLGSDFDLLVVTGSNTGGKTVALKTVALLVLMAQSGMHIPARRGATMPAFRDVFIDVGDEQSLQQSLSTFGWHVKRINYVLRKADKNSLVLLDELGAGTDPDEGGAIGQAVLDELRQIGCVGMATTHLSVLKAYALNHERVDNASVEFDTKTLSPTYHLKIGTPGESHAIAVARRLGMPKRITEAASRHLSSQGAHFRRAIRATGQARQVAEKARQEAQDARFQAQAVQESYEAKLADLHRLQEQFEAWLAQLPRLRPGDEILVPSLNQTGRLARLELHAQRALVDVGSMQIEVPLKDLMPDLGQDAVRKQIDLLGQQILDQAAATEQARGEAARVRQEYQRSLEHQRQRVKQFDDWLQAIGRLKVGDEVSVAGKPGRAKVVAVDLPGLRATVETRDGRATIPLQDLLPEAAPFAPATEQDRKRRTGKPQEAQPSRRPIRRHAADSAAARRNRQAVLDTKPGSQVFVVPFNKRATLIRVNEDKNQAVVQSGIFEIEIPLADLEPVSGPA